MPKAKPKKPICWMEIDVDLANAINHYLYAHVGKHANPGFLCPECKKPVEAVWTDRKKSRHFRHVKETDCTGPKSWERKKSK
jgi:competence CoiA-like predicted nuclease